MERSFHPIDPHLVLEERLAVSRDRAAQLQGQRVTNLIRRDDRRTKYDAAIEDLGLREEEGIRALDVPCRYVVAQCVTKDLAALGQHHRQLRLGCGELRV